MSEKPKAYAPGLYVVPGRAVNIYLLDDPAEGVTIVDTGLLGAKGSVLKQLKAIGREPQDVAHILVTHADIDHVGSLAPIARKTGAPVSAGADAAEFIRRRTNPPHMGMPAAAISAVMNFVFRRAAPVAQIVQDGQRLDIAGGITAYHTPGHTPDHFAYFWEREQVLFCGDLFNMWDGLGLTPPRISWSTDAARESARRMLDLAPRVICPGHGPVWRAQDDPDGLARLRASLEG